jgi:error-prone DNA polymerase
MYDLVVQVALIRPGPIQARFVHPYTRRRRGIEEVTYAHPDLEPILERTYGIPIFQEQAMAISMALGGCTASRGRRAAPHDGQSAQAPRLRGARPAARQRMEARGISPETAEASSRICSASPTTAFPRATPGASR